MTEVDRRYAERRTTPPPPPIPDDTVAVWLTGIFAVASVVAVIFWIVSWI